MPSLRALKFGPDISAKNLPSLAAAEPQALCTLYVLICRAVNSQEIHRYRELHSSDQRVPMTMSGDEIEARIDSCGAIAIRKR